MQAFIPGTPFLHPRPQLRQAEPPYLTPSTAPEPPKCVALSSSLSEESDARNRLLQRQEETSAHMCYIDMISLEGHEKAATGGPGVQEREPRPRATLKNAL